MCTRKKYESYSRTPGTIAEKGKEKNENLGSGWHLGLFKNLYDELGIFTRKEPLIHLGILSMVLQGLILAYLYPMFYKGSNRIQQGLKFGLLMGIFMGSNAVFGEAGKQEVTSLSTWLILESIYYLLQFGIVGVVIGLIYGENITKASQEQNL